MAWTASKLTQEAAIVAGNIQKYGGDNPNLTIATRLAQRFVRDRCAKAANQHPAMVELTDQERSALASVLASLALEACRSTDRLNSELDALTKASHQGAKVDRTDEAAASSNLCLPRAGSFQE